MWSLEQIIGGAIAMIVAGMPAMIALLKINELHVLVNSRLTELILSTAKASYAAGQLEGRDEVRKAAEIESAIIIQDATDLAKKLLAEAAEKARVIIAEAVEKARVIIAEAVEKARVIIAEAANEALEDKKDS